MRRLREIRVSLSHLGMISAVSAVISGLIVVSAFGETGAERAVIAALRTPQIIHASRPASATAAPSTTAPAPAPPAAGSGGGAGSGSAGTGSAGSSASSGTGSGSGSGLSTGSSGPAAASAAQTPAASTKIKHVFVINLDTPSFAAAFGHGSAARYLNGTLRPRGTLLSEYRSLGSAPLADLIAMVAGQPPNRDTASGCTTYSEFATTAQPAADGVLSASGCVYPNTVLTVGDQLQGANDPWRAYVGAMSTPCQHPNSDAADPAPLDPTAYATRQNPFVYFHSLLDLGGCQSDDLPLTKLGPSLHGPARRVPALSFIAPDLCDAGGAASCTGTGAGPSDVTATTPGATGSSSATATTTAPPAAPTTTTGQTTSSPGTSTPASTNPTSTTPATATAPGGLLAADAYLKAAVPAILHSAAYRSSGVLLILFSALPVSTPRAAPVRTGALILSPFARAGAVRPTAYGPYSVLRWLERTFGLSALAEAAHARPLAPVLFAGG